mmetsp:Transcript_21645/g.39731  ORF Transcript_21645/g.39731 Transcript_21645/m.39731 type:complete len:87 (-) Transcript_21645:1259-1519(-)
MINPNKSSESKWFVPKNNAIVQIVSNDTTPPQLQSEIVITLWNVPRAFEESRTGGFFRTTVLGGCHEMTIVVDMVESSVAIEEGDF